MDTTNDPDAYLISVKSSSSHEQTVAFNILTTDMSLPDNFTENNFSLRDGFRKFEYSIETLVVSINQTRWIVNHLNGSNIFEKAINVTNPIFNTSFVSISLNMAYLLFLVIDEEENSNENLILK